MTIRTTKLTPIMSCIFNVKDEFLVASPYSAAYGYKNIVRYQSKILLLTNKFVTVPDIDMADYFMFQRGWVWIPEPKLMF